MTHPTFARMRAARPAQAGFSLVELMVSITIGLIILVAMCAMFVNVSSANSELAKSNSQIENGRSSIQLLEADVMHAGFWGPFVPQFDDINWSGTPNDTPLAIPDPCLAYNAANWTGAYVDALIGIGVQSSDAAPGSCALAARKANTDVLVVRHAANCVQGEPNCDAEVNGKMYFQSSLCATGTADQVQSVGNTPVTVALKLASATNTTSTADNAYAGMTIRITAGTGAGQSRVISTYNATSAVATVTTAWSTTPDSTSRYVIVENMLGTSGFSLHNRGADCAVASATPKRKFVSNIYYVRSYANTIGDGIPTLMRSSFDPSGPPALAHQAAEPLVEGVEGFAVELGLDNVVTRCGLNGAVDLSAPIAKVDPSTCALNIDPLLNTLPTNRGDGNPDQFVRCTTAAPCTPAQLANAVVAKFYVLVRNTEPTSGYTDTKTYCLASIPASGTCPPASVLGPFNDGYKRHLFANTVRLTTVSGRRETAQ